MKELIFFAGFLLCVPTGIFLCIISRTLHSLCFAALVFGTTNTAGLFGLPLDINFLSREWYRGTTLGIEVSYLDLLTIILLASTLIVRHREGRKLAFIPKSSGWMVAFLLYACAHTLVLADPKLFALFEISKIIRGIVIFTTVALYVRSRRELELLLWALCAAVAYEAAMCLRDRYVYGIHRVSGTLGHPNNLSLYMLVIVPFMITTTLSDARPALRIASFLGFFLACGCVILTISRTGYAALVLLTLTCGAVTMGLKLSVRNILIVGLTGLAFLGILARSWDTIESRMFSQTFEDEFAEDTTQGRGVYFRYLMLIMRDRPMGVGINNWSYAVTNDYAELIDVIYIPYTGTDTAPDKDIGRVSQTMGGTQSAPAHNVFILTMGELGWIGIILFLGMMGTWLYMGAIFFANRGDSIVSRFGMAAFFAIGAIILQGMTEWIFRVTPIFIQAHVIMGALAAIYRHRIAHTTAPR